MGVTAEMIEGEGFNPGDLQHRETWNEGEGEGFGSRDLQYRGTQIGTELAFPSPDENFQASFPPSDHFQTWFSIEGWKCNYISTIFGPAKRDIIPMFRVIFLMQSASQITILGKFSKHYYY